MKQRIFYLLTMLLLSLFMFSCDKDTSDVGPTQTTQDSVVPVSDYCQLMVDWVVDNYPPTTAIDSVLQVTGQTNNGNETEVFEVYLSNGVVAFFLVSDCSFLYLECNCDQGYDPVCWNNSTYNNQCEAECAGATAEDTTLGECGACNCSEVYDPVCWNDLTYVNQCEAECDGASANDTTPGECYACDCAGESYDPVCWDDVTYYNQCEAECAGATSNDTTPGECNVCANGNIADCSGESYDPVCWNGTTYDNACLAICDGANPAELMSGPCTANSCESQVQTIFGGIFITINSTTDNGNGYTLNVTVGNDITHSIDVMFDYNCEYYSPCGCVSNFDIACGDGTNYLNACEAVCAGTQQMDVVYDWCD